MFLAAALLFEQRLNLSDSVGRVPVLYGGFRGPLGLFVGGSRVRGVGSWPSPIGFQVPEYFG